MASERPLHPNTSHFHLEHAPLTCWRHTMLPWTTLRLDWGCISSGEGPSSGLHGNSNSGAVLDSWLIICVLFVNNCCKKKNFDLGRNWSQLPIYGQNRTVRWHRLVRSDTIVLADCNLDRTVRGFTVRNPTLRKCTGLHVIHIKKGYYTPFISAFFN